MPLFETKKIDLPNGEWAEVRELSVDDLKEADRRGTEAAVSLMRMLPEKVVESQLQRQRDAAMERIIRFEGYDPAYMILRGVTAWSFNEPCDEEHKAQVGAKLGEQLARAVFELSVLPSGEVAPSSLKQVEVVSQPDSSERTSSTTPEGVSPSQSSEAPPTDS